MQRKTFFSNQLPLTFYEKNVSVRQEINMKQEYNPQVFNIGCRWHNWDTIAYSGLEFQGILKVCF